jgi:hypothetical protein
MFVLYVNRVGEYQQSTRCRNLYPNRHSCDAFVTKVAIHSASTESATTSSLLRYFLHHPKRQGNSIIDISSIQHRLPDKPYYSSKHLIRPSESSHPSPYLLAHQIFQIIHHSRQWHLPCLTALYATMTTRMWSTNARGTGVRAPINSARDVSKHRLMT